MQQLALAPAPGRNPFRLSIGPDAAFLEGGWGRARNEAIAAAFGPPGLVFITGGPGTGKTLLLAALVDALKARYRPALHIRHGEIPPPERDRAILLVDEGDRLDDVAHERIVARSASFPCIVAGSPVLPASFGAAARDGSIIELAPMAPAEVGRFLADRLMRAGLPPTLFTEQAVAALSVYSRGTSRVAAILASSAWMISGGSPDTQITADHVIEAVTIRDGVPPASLPAAAATEVTTATPQSSALTSESHAAAIEEEADFEESFKSLAVAGPEPTSEAPAPIPVSERRAPVFETNPSTTPVALAATLEIAAPMAVPPRKRLSSLAAEPFYAAAAATILAVVALGAFVERDRIGVALAALAAPAAGESGIRAASPAPTAPSAMPASPAPAATPSESAAPQAAPVPPAAAQNATSGPAVQALARPATRIVMLYHRGDAAAQRRASALAIELRQTGLDVEAPKPAGQRVAHARLEYFFDQDRDAAAAVAAYLGPRFGQETPGRPDPSVQPGTVVVWVPSAVRPSPPYRQRTFPETVAGWFR